MEAAKRLRVVGKGPSGGATARPLESRPRPTLRKLMPRIGVGERCLMIGRDIGSGSLLELPALPTRTLRWPVTVAGGERGSLLRIGRGVPSPGHRAGTRGGPTCHPDPAQVRGCRLGSYTRSAATKSPWPPGRSVRPPRRRPRAASLHPLLYRCCQRTRRYAPQACLLARKARRDL